MKTCIIKFYRKDRSEYHPLMKDTYSARVLFRNAEYEILLVSYSEDFFTVPNIGDVLTPQEMLDFMDINDKNHKMFLKDNVLYYPMKNPDMGRVGFGDKTFQNKKNNIQFRPE